ncbi:MAG: hypothetical protein Q4B67_08520 [Eubacteriales bacterium]|nr:hypothetical protein [Eubacteriales bacterium]
MKKLGIVFIIISVLAFLFMILSFLVHTGTHDAGPGFYSFWFNNFKVSGITAAVTLVLGIVCRIIGKKQSKR